MRIAFNSTSSFFQPYDKYGCFALLGVDFMIDSEFNAHLIEYTKTPAGHSTLEKDDTLFADLMDETIDIVLEVNEKYGLLPSPALTRQKVARRIP